MTKVPQPPLGTSPSSDLRRERAAQSLCPNCGLCCDGTLFSRVDLASEDDIGALSSLGLHIVPDTAPPSFRQLCAAYKNRLCSIYTDRPHACRRFRCALLKRFEANKLSQADALKIIREAITLRDHVKENMRHVFDDDCTFVEFTPRLKARLKDATSIEAKHRISLLFEKFAALWLCINKNFRLQWRR